MLEIAFSVIIFLAPLVVIEWLVTHSRIARELFIKFGKAAKLL